MIKYLVFGSTGQIATAFKDVVDNAIFINRSTANLLNTDACTDIIKKSDADVIVNLAAYTGVKNCPDNMKEAYIVNSITPIVMAQAAKDNNKVFIHISTDYVYNGKKKKAYKEKNRTHPINSYGITKELADIGISRVGGTYAIIRTSWVFSDKGKNFVNTIKNLATNQSSISVVDDQIGGPTSASSIASIIPTIAKKLLRNSTVSGVYNYSGVPAVSWADFAEYIVKSNNYTCKINRISTKGSNDSIKRPKNSRLDCSKIYRTFNIEQPYWPLNEV